MAELLTGEQLKVPWGLAAGGHLGGGSSCAAELSLGWGSVLLRAVFISGSWKETSTSVQTAGSEESAENRNWFCGKCPLSQHP